jgi:hypothetical protein
MLGNDFVDQVLWRSDLVESVHVNAGTVRDETDGVTR